MLGADNHPRNKKPTKGLQEPVIWAVLGLLLLVSGCSGPHEQGVVFRKGKPLEYLEDQFGNHIPDYSTAGYRSGAGIPEASTIATLQPTNLPDDDTRRIQQAIDEAGQREPDARGFRGAVLLKAGHYNLSGSIRIEHSGVILRGEGQFEGGTIIHATGSNKRSLIVISRNDPEQDTSNELSGRSFSYRESNADSWEVIDAFVPSGTQVVQVAPVRGLHTGDTVVLEQRMNEEWVKVLGMDQFPPRPDGRPNKPWDPADFVFQFERTIEKVDGGRIHLDAPLVNPVFAKFGSTRLFKSLLPNRVENAGIEALRLVSSFDEAGNGKDEAHAWTGVALERARNCWVRGVTSVYFGNACVAAGVEAIQISVESCAFLKPVALDAYGRRHGFINAGQKTLMQRCFTEDCSFPFFISEKSAGPNAFLDCYARGDKSVIGPWRFWAMGTLWDNTYGQHLMIRNRGYEGQGWGWSGINQLFWKSTAFDWISVQSPINGWNWAIGCQGKPAGAPFQGLTGPISFHDQAIEPRSLFMRQLEDRLGSTAALKVFAENQRSGSVFYHIRDTLSE